GEHSVAELAIRVELLKVTVVPRPAIQVDHVSHPREVHLPNIVLCVFSIAEMIMYVDDRETRLQNDGFLHDHLAYRPPIQQAKLAQGRFAFGIMCDSHRHQYWKECNDKKETETHGKGSGLMVVPSGWRPKTR